MRGDTLAEGIAVKAPGRITQAIVRELVDDILLVSEQEIEHAVSLLINIEKTVVEGAGAAGLAAVLKEPERFKGRMRRPGAVRRQHRHAAARQRADARAGPRGPPHPARHRSRRSAGQLAKVANLLGEAGANIVEVYHQRIFSDLPAKAALLEVVIETRDRAAPGRDGGAAAGPPASRSRCEQSWRNALMEGARMLPRQAARRSRCCASSSARCCGSPPT